jgi:methionyl-tRNA formyltransferase
MRLVFLGTPAFAVPTLEHIVEAGHQVLAVVTQPDRPRGRGEVLAPPPVKESALRFGLPVYQPERVRRPEAVEYLRALAPDAMVVVGYGQIIPQTVIDIPPLGIINVHASLLPKYRGAGPIQWAILNGETRTGVTTMRIDAGLDTGDMLLKAETEIAGEESAIDLGKRLSVMGAGLLVRTLDGLAAGSIVPEKQDSSQATLAPLLKKEDGIIDWRLPAPAIRNRVRGLQPWPGAYTSFRGRTLHIWRARIAENAPALPAGTLFVGQTPWSARDPLVPQTSESQRTAPHLLVGCGQGALELLDVQLEGRKRMPAADFANGQRLAEQDKEILGDLPA